MALWLLEQCSGLAAALCTVHYWDTDNGTILINNASNRHHESGGHDTGTLKLSGRHGDIKPSNILWYPHGELGILKLADFGTTRFGLEGTPTPVYHDAPTTPTYRAPEYSLQMAMKSSWDIWTIGCVYIEFITWLSLGWKGVDEFAIKRLREDPQDYDIQTATYYVLENATPRLKKEVNDVSADGIVIAPSSRPCANTLRSLASRGSSGSCSIPEGVP